MKDSGIAGTLIACVVLGAVGTYCQSQAVEGTKRAPIASPHKMGSNYDNDIPVSNLYPPDVSAPRVVGSLDGAVAWIPLSEVQVDGAVTSVLGTKGLVASQTGGTVTIGPIVDGAIIGGYWQLLDAGYARFTNLPAQAVVPLSKLGGDGGVDGQVPTWNGSAYVLKTPAGFVQGIVPLSKLGGDGGIDGQVPTWNGSAYVLKTPAGFVQGIVPLSKLGGDGGIDGQVVTWNGTAYALKTPAGFVQGIVPLSKLGGDGGIDGQVPTWNGTAYALKTPSAGFDAAAITPQRPASDTSTLIDYRFNEQAFCVLVNHGSYGTLFSPIGPIPTTTSGSYTQPSIGSSVSIPLTSTTGFKVGQEIRVDAQGTPLGAGSNYYYVTGVSGSNLTVTAIGCGTTCPSKGNYISSGNTVSAGTAVAVSVDLVSPGNGCADTQSTNTTLLRQIGLYDFVTSWPQNSGINQWTNGNQTKGSPDFNGLTQFSVHVLLRPQCYNNTSYSELFGYQHTANTYTGYADMGIALTNCLNGNWTTRGNNGSPPFGNVTSNNWQGAGQAVWTLLSWTVNITSGHTSQAMYVNGQAINTADAGIGTLFLADGGAWYVGNALGWGDQFTGSLHMARFESTARSASYIQNMWNTIQPGETSWPVP